MLQQDNDPKYTAKTTPCLDLHHTTISETVIMPGQKNIHLKYIFAFIVYTVKTYLFFPVFFFSQ